MAAEVLTSPPTVEPVTLAEAKTHLRVDIPDDDTLITSLITVAREQCEAFTKRALITQTWQLMLDSWPEDGTDPVELPFPPVQSVTSVTYKDINGAVTTMTAGTDYYVDTSGEPARIYLAPYKTWPGVQLWPINAITITFVAGYGNAEANVPLSLRQGMLMLIGHMYENRETVLATGAVGKELPMSTEYCWWPFRFFRW